jgi:hypothetical protein
MERFRSSLHDFTYPDISRPSDFSHSTLTITSVASIKRPTPLSSLAGPEVVQSLEELAWRMIADDFLLTLTLVRSALGEK